MISYYEYWSAQREEARGSRASWNARDQHMTQTLIRLKENREMFEDLIDREQVKIIAWAHNSHISDRTATPQGGEGFDANETWNLGQMASANLKGVFKLGFYTYNGTVR